MPESRLEETIRPVFSLGSDTFDSAPSCLIRRNGLDLPGASTTITPMTSAPVRSYQIAFTPMASNAWSANDELQMFVTGLSGGKIVEAALNVRIRNSFGKEVWEHTSRSLTNFGTLISDIATAVWSFGGRTLEVFANSAGVNTLITLITPDRASKIDRLDENVSAPKHIITASQEALAALFEARLLNDGDNVAFVNAIVAAINNQNIDQTILVAAIRNDLERNGGALALLLLRNNPLSQAQMESLYAAQYGTLADTALTQAQTIATQAEAESWTEDDRTKLFSLQNTNTTALAKESTLNSTRFDVLQAIDGIEVGTGGGETGGGSADLGEMPEQVEFIFNRFQVQPLSAPIEVAPLPPSTNGMVNVVVDVLDFGVAKAGTKITMSIIGQGPVIYNSQSIESDREITGRIGAEGRTIFSIYPSSTLTDGLGNSNLKYRIYSKELKLDIQRLIENDCTLVDLINQQ